MWDVIQIPGMVSGPQPYIVQPSGGKRGGGINADQDGLADPIDEHIC